VTSVNGGEISIFNTPAKFQAADIIANYYMSVNAPCQAFPGHDSDRNDTYLDQYEWGWHSQQPERVAALCKAMWHNMKFADLVTAGEGCMNYLDESQWPLGFPTDWNPVNTMLNLNGSWTDGSPRSAAISVEFPSSLKVRYVLFNRPTASGSIDDWDSIRVTFPMTGRIRVSLKLPTN